MKAESKLAARPSFNEEDLPGILRDIEAVLRSGRLILGPHTEALEREFATYVGTKHAVAVSSCSAALDIALSTIFVRGADVILPTNTFVATAASVVRTGGFVLFCESASDFTPDVDDILAKLDHRIAAVIVVHVGGFISSGMERLMVECRKRGIRVVEDCAHAHGATLYGKQAGSIGDIGCFSFYPTKIMTCGVGGMLTTNDDDVATKARSLRHHGQGSSLEDVVAIGNDYLMDEMRAVIARAQLKRLDEVVQHRRQVAAVYNAFLGNSAPVPAAGVDPSYYKYPVTLPEGVDRDRVRHDLRERFGIETGSIYWPPVHLQPAFRGMRRRLPRTERLLQRQLCLPMHAAVDPVDCQEIVEALQSCIASQSR